MAINLINKDTIITLEKRLMQLLSTDKTFESSFINSALSISRLTLETLNLQKNFDNLTTDILGKFDKYDSQELLINLMSEITRLTDYYLIADKLINETIAKTDQQIADISAALEFHKQKIRLLETKIFPNSNVHGLLSNIIKIVHNTLNIANPNEFIICDSNNDIELKLSKGKIGDLIVIANASLTNTVSIGVDYVITSSSVVTLMCYNEKWIQIPNVRNCQWESIKENYKVISDQSIVLLADTELTITLPDNPIIDTPQFITIVNINPENIITINSNTYNILDDVSLELDAASITLMFIGNKWIISTNMSNFIFVNSNYTVESNNMILLVDQPSTMSYEISLPKNPENLYTVTISDVRGSFNEDYPCRVLAYHEISTGFDEVISDKYLELDIKFVSVTLQFISNKWLIKT
jgi:hypothetical protein